ncbi:ornithine cyclodeaminase family protein [Kribbella sp. VKM Ac-2566]|uniref:ornithine cyclodeaminase family protein n=1 Tax=Kribbella sp. VKM Ac-2566 TaxID=2512218 RepID=UPI00106307DD|nr:NAD(P)-binding domain-containing protein [Kribbella sp. VKM Ac-2566]TDW98323.1 ornithine cyclodeaminase [Kribbella sp. VKM Ac-2566]
MTALLTRSDVLQALDVPAVLDALRAGFLQSSEIEPLRIRTDLPGPGTATALLPGVIPGIPAYTVKVNAKFPGATPALRGVVCLHDTTDGTLLALLDSSTITAWRTGLAAALATDALAPAGTVGIIGAGAQAAMTLAGLVALRRVDRLVVHDVVPERASEFLAQQGIPGVVVSSPQEVAAAAEVVVLATWSREPLLTAADVRPGSHLTTLGADEPGKVELSADLLTAARVIVDDRSLAAQMGALGNVGLAADAAHATLTDVLNGVAAGRRSAEEVTVYAPVGLPWQDLAVAWPVYQASKGDFRTVDFLS